MSETQEIALGAQYDPSVISTFGVYESPELMNFITAEGNKMGAISHRPNLQYHFKILDSPVVNAFAVPGGYIYFTRGILAQFNNEAELMGVLGHEMGHVTARHSLSQQTKQTFGQVLLAGGMVVAPDLAQYADYAMQGMQLLFLKFSRDNEREADRLGVEYSSKIGYDATRMADFFNVLNKMNMESEHAGVPTFMSTHPDPGDRYNAVRATSSEWQQKLGNTEWKVNNKEYLRLIDGLVYGEDPRQGFVEYNTFYHPGMKFRYPIPEGWQFENSPVQVKMAPKDGKALIAFLLSDKKTAEEAAENFVAELKVATLENKKLNVNGMPAVAVVSQQISQDQQSGAQSVVKFLSYFIQYNGLVFSFHGVAADADFNNYVPVFRATIEKFDKLTDAAKLNVKPKRIKIVEVPATASLGQTFKSFKVQDSQMNELALLNDIELTEQVTKGMLIKIISNQ
jgi:predicted Zn-dependent protease